MLNVNVYYEEAAANDSGLDLTSLREGQGQIVFPNFVFNAIRGQGQLDANRRVRALEFWGQTWNALNWLANGTFKFLEATDVRITNGRVVGSYLLKTLQEIDNIKLNFIGFPEEFWDTQRFQQNKNERVTKHSDNQAPRNRKHDSNKDQASEKEKKPAQRNTNSPKAAHSKRRNHSPASDAQLAQLAESMNQR